MGKSPYNYNSVHEMGTEIKRGAVGFQGDSRVHRDIASYFLPVVPNVFLGK
jgi:hypothetical protein